MSDSDSDSDSESFNTPLRSAINSALSMQPESVNLSDIRKKLTDNLVDSSGHRRHPPQKTPPRNTRNNSKSNQFDDRQAIKNSFDEIVHDIGKIQNKLDSLVSSLLDILSKVESLEDRVARLETTLADSSSNPRSFADVVAKNAEITKKSSDRISKLEFTTSEEERKKRLLQVTIKHPLLNFAAPNLVEHVKGFFQQHLKMESREIDCNLAASKAPKDNKVIVAFSHKRFKIFLYTARKSLRQSNEDATKDLYINDNLTTYNFGILMQLKRERARRVIEDLPNFAVVYTFSGRVYVKIERGASNDDAMVIKNTADVSALLRRLDGST